MTNANERIPPYRAPCEQEEMSNHKSIKIGTNIIREMMKQKPHFPFIDAQVHAVQYFSKRKEGMHCIFALIFGFNFHSRVIVVCLTVQLIGFADSNRK